MRRAFLAGVFCFATVAAFAQALNVSPQGLTAGSTPVGGCTTLNMFYNNAGVLGCMVGTSWDNTNRSLTITGSGTTTNKVITTKDSGGTTRFVVQDNGAVGIGTVAPTAQLDVFGSMLVEGGASSTDFRVGRQGSPTLYLSISAPGGGISTFTVNGTSVLSMDINGAVARLVAFGPIKRKGYAIASLPTGSVGDEAYVTDQLTACPVIGGTFTNGGNVVCSAFFDGTAWTHQ